MDSIAVSTPNSILSPASVHEGARPVVASQSLSTAPETQEPQESHHSAPATRSLIFRIAGHDYLSPVNTLREVVPYGVTTRIPGAPAHVIGVMNIRGTIVTVIDGGIFLHNTPSDRQNGAILLIDMGTRSAGILVDRVIDIRLPLGGDGLYHPLDLREVVSRVVAISENV